MAVIPVQLEPLGEWCYATCYVSFGLEEDGSSTRISAEDMPFKPRLKPWPAIYAHPLFSEIFRLSPDRSYLAVRTIRDYKRDLILAGSAFVQPQR